MRSRPDLPANPNGPGRLSRRQALAALPGIIFAPGLLARAAQTPAPRIPVARLHGFAIRVPDPERTLRFYQRLFGMPVQASRDDTVHLRIGDGPQFMSVSPTVRDEAPSISHICISVPDFDADRLLGTLAELGFTESDPPAPGSMGIDNAMKAWVRLQDGETPELYFADARGLVIQLQDPAYCGGRGPLGNTCENPDTGTEPEIAPITLEDLSHFTVFVSDGAGAEQFYRDTMGFFPQAYQATTPALGVGDGIQFLMFAGGGGGRGRGRGGGAAPAAAPANIHHACFNMDGFVTDEVLETLTGYGLTSSNANTGPLVHYVSLRMPDRGGAEGGTPELYFTDPDGLLMQIQDSNYCGGGGILGDVCG